MKTIIIWSCVLLLICFVIAIPCVEQARYAKNDPSYQDSYVISLETIKDTISYGKEIN